MKNNYKIYKGISALIGTIILLVASLIIYKLEKDLSDFIFMILLSLVSLISGIWYIKKGLKEKQENEYKLKENKD